MCQLLVTWNSVKILKFLNDTTPPKGIRDFKYGISLDAYKFDKNSQSKLGFLGLGNVDIVDNQTVILVE